MRDFVGKAGEWLLSPLGKRVLWVLFAVLFYQSGLTFTIWLVEPHNFGGTWREWALTALFPFLVPAFFWVNKRLGCATGACASGQCDLPAEPSGGARPDRSADDEFLPPRMPGC